MNTYTINKYRANRKFYIKELHRYTTLKEIKVFWLAGDKFTVNEVGVNFESTDITQETVVDALTFDSESKRKMFTFMTTFLTSGAAL